MPRRAALGVVLIAFLLSGAAAKYGLEDSWRARGGGPPHEFKKLLVLTISDDREGRHRFEDRAVSLLRGRGLGAVTSYSIVPDLQTVENPEEIVRIIEEQEIDGAISVRLVPMEGVKKPEWAEQWRGEVEQGGDLRGMIDEALPLPAAKKQNVKYGVEITLWETKTWTRVWGGRTGVYSRKKFRDKASSFVQSTVGALASDGLLARPSHY